ncbi:MAG: sugar transferase [Clostridiales bacterium]|jgi:lipopolysaccharide/colanic/teichoic acid biosynthesis glycosyltransferase|nr:sugar transferase [Clostridiales bacterium]
MIRRIKKNHRKGNIFLFIKFVACFIVILFSFLVVFKSVDILKYKHTIPMIALVVVGYLITLMFLQKLSMYPKVNYPGLILYSLIISYLAIVSMIGGLRIYYSRAFLLLSFIFSFVMLLALYFLENKTGKFKFVSLSPISLAEEKAFAKSNIEILPGLDSGHADYEGIIIKEIKDLPPDLALRITAEAIKGIPIYSFAEFYAAFLGKVPLDYVSPELLERRMPYSIYSDVKRTLEFVATLICLIPAAVIGLFISVLIKLDSKGPILYIQERVGQHGKVFKLIKFRTMFLDSESDGPQFAEQNDSRVTKVGKILRKTRLDELPQIINILRDDMSLVGPRPEQIPFAREFERLIPFYSLRYAIKPGLTGWAQIHRGYTSGIDDTKEKLEYDLFYVKYLSPWLDLLIIFKTLRILITGFGAR